MTIKMTSFLRKTPFLMLALTLIVSAVYFKLPWQFFQQDEWHHLGQEYIWHQKGIIEFFAQDAISFVGIRFLPLGALLNYIQFSVFGVNPTGYSIVSLSLHLINTLLVYLVVKKLIGRDRVAFLAALFFGVWASHQQAATWLIQHSTTLPALTFSLLAIYFFAESKLFLSFLSILAAIFFKETAYFLFPFLVLLPLFSGGKIKNIFKLKSVRVVLVTGIVYAAVLAAASFIQPKAQSEIFLPRTGFVQTIGRRIFSVPLRAVAQSVFQESMLINMSKTIANLPVIKAFAPAAGTPQFDVFVEQVVGKRTMYFIAAVLLVVCIFALRRIWSNKHSQDTKGGILIGLGIIIFGSFPLLFISTLAGNFTYFESRYLYIIGVGSALLLALLFDRLIASFGKLAWIFVLLLVVGNGVLISNTLSGQVEIGNQRRAILAKIMSDRPDLAERTVFYTESDIAFYGLPIEDKILPFQSGLGETLLISYQPTENFPVEFYEDDFLWEITSQGYKEIGGRGFGYFRDMNLLKEALKKYNLPIESVVAFKFESGVGALTDITDQVSIEIKNGNKKR